MSTEPLNLSALYLALYEYLDTNPRGLLNESGLSEFRGFGYGPGAMRAALSSFVSQGYLVRNQDSDKSGPIGELYWEMTEQGISFFHRQKIHAAIEAEKVKASTQKRTSYGALGHIALRQGNTPATGQFVALSDDDPRVAEAINVLDQLAFAVQGNNELFANEKDRLCIIREVEGIRSQLLTGVLRSASIWLATQAGGVLRWLIEAGAQGIIGDLATDASKRLLALLKG